MISVELQNLVWEGIMLDIENLHSVLLTSSQCAGSVEFAKTVTQSAQHLWICPLHQVVNFSR